MLAQTPEEAIERLKALMGSASTPLASISASAAAPAAADNTSDSDTGSEHGSRVGGDERTSETVPTQLQDR
jgi:hypothetical protein